MRAGLISLTDANNFYVSCHRVFDPKLIGKPVVCLSNGDGCVVARSNEVKKLGVKMGHPWFQLKDLAKQHNIIALSSQYTLYGSMSNRVLDIMRTFCKSVEPYSIDENFLSWEGMEGHWPTATTMGRTIGETVLRYTGIPTCTGVAQTKTLAKLANFIAKKRPEFGGVCDLSAFSDNDLSAMLQSIPVGEIWGVGRRLDAHLAQLGINTVDDLRRASSSWLRAHFGVVMERTGTELRGIPCLNLEEIAPAKKQIVSSNEVA
jgi:DNA polymerase V